MRTQRAPEVPAIEGHDRGPARLRVAVVTESFLPTPGPATEAACRTLEHLARRGHDAVVISPGPAPATFAGAPVIGVRSVSYRRTPVGLPSARVLRTLAAFAPDVVHLSSPYVLGAVGATAADQLDVPSVAVFREFRELPSPGGPGFGRRPGTATNRLAWRWIRGIHAQADLTLAASAGAYRQLRRHEVPRVTLWEPAVDGERFTPHRRAGAAAEALRARLAPAGEVLVGVDPATARAHGDHLLADGVRLVVLGDGPDRADVCAALDVFVQCSETSSEAGSGAGSDADPGPAGASARRSVQEVMSSGVPVVTRAGGPAATLVATGLNGLVVDPAGDGLRDAVLSLATDPERRRWMARAARAGVERSSWEVLGDELIGHYRSVLRRRAHAA